MATPGDLTYPEHGMIGLGKYLNAAASYQPSYATLDQSFRNFGQQGPLVRGGQFINPSEAQQYATAPYLQARGNLAQSNIQNMFQLAQLAALTGAGRGQTAAMIPELQAQQVALQSTGLFGGLL